MSTIVMKDEIGQVCDALYWDAMGARRLLHAVCDQVPPFPSKNTIDDDKSGIYEWANRVYIANQIAYILTYSHRSDCDRKIQMLDRDCWHNGADLIKNPARFYRTLESITYNLYSNGGQVLLCHEDMERLDNLKAMLAREVVGEYQKEKGRA